MSETEQNVPNDDFISRKWAIDALLELVEARRTWVSIEDARKEISGIDASMCAIHDLPSAHPTQPNTFNTLEALEKVKDTTPMVLPLEQPEKLTDKEQRIFLSAMGREEKVCEEVDRNYVREPYEDSLMYVCKEIKRKVKGALWT